MTGSILIIDDEVKMGKALKHVLGKEGYNVDTADDPVVGLSLLEQNHYDLLLCDLKMPNMSGLDVLERSKAIQTDLNVIMMTAFASAETAVDSMKKGAYDYLIKPFAMDELKILVGRCMATRAIEHENVVFRDQLREALQPEDFVCVSKIMQSIMKRARKVAESSATVLITGESGTGKEVLAKAIHAASPRGRQPFLTINCGAVPETLLESELFGHKRGSFTGAEQSRIGLFEAANHGTVFLDEVGEVSPAMQVKLLRVLQSGEFQRVGDPSMIRVDVRVIAATNRNLEKMVQEGTFRTDLYYRLNVVPLFIPPLRERWEDIRPLIDHFLRKFGRGRGYVFTSEALDLLESYDWPGNVRELENAVEHAIVLSEDENLTSENLPMSIRSFGGAEVKRGGVWWMEKMTLGDVEKRMLEAAMERTLNNMTKAARHLGITRRTLGYRLRKHGLYKKGMDEDVDNNVEDEVEDEEEQ
jgi:DNA-binding NtrC family response regulator